MEDECIDIQLIQSVWAESRACTLFTHWNIVYWRDFLLIPTGSSVCIRRNILVFLFADSSIYNLFIYGTTLPKSILETSFFSTCLFDSHTPPPFPFKENGLKIECQTKVCCRLHFFRNINTLFYHKKEENRSCIMRIPVWH